MTAGERWTHPRRRTYQMLAESGQPVKAYDLIAAFGEGRAPAKPATVYRSLKFLEGLGLAHRVASLSAFAACAGGGGRHHAEFLICDCCGRVDECDLGAGALAQGASVAAGFDVRQILMEAHGLCGLCAEDRKLMAHDARRS